MRVYLYMCDYLERKGVNLYSKKGGKERMEDNEEESWNDGFVSRAYYCVIIS